MLISMRFWHLIIEVSCDREARSDVLIRIIIIIIVR